MTPPSADSDTCAVAAAEGCAKLAAQYDWSQTDLGAVQSWSPTVQALVHTMLDADVPMAYCHGAGYAMVYNDLFADLLGVRHPQAWGQRVAVVVPEVWLRPGLADMFDGILAGGPPLHHDGQPSPAAGKPVGAESAFVRCYSGVRDSDGSVLGVLAVAVEVSSESSCVGEERTGARRGSRWQGAGLWDEVIAAQPFLWSGLRAGASSTPGADVEIGRRFVAEGGGGLVSPPASKKPSTTTTLGSGAFYDGFRLPDGRLAVAIGQVVGGGVVAVGQVRACVRAAAVTSSDLDAIFAALDELVSGPKQPTVRALLGIFEPATGELLLASAGHFPPVVVRGSAGTEAQGCLQRRAAFAEVENGPSLGIPGSRPVLRLVLREGDALVAFTDGLIDGKAEGQTQGQPILLEALSGIASTTPRSICHHVADEVIGDQALDDECALLAVVRDSEVHQLATVLVPPQAGAVLEARRWVRVLLQSWGLDEETAADAVLGVSELVTNVVLYAGTPARVSVELADRLLVTVEDTGTTGVPELDLPEDPTAVRGRGLVLVAAMSDSMGHARGVGGSTVWFEIGLGGRAAATQGRS